MMIDSQKILTINISFIYLYCFVFLFGLELTGSDWVTGGYKRTAFPLTWDYTQDFFSWLIIVSHNNLFGTDSQVVLACLIHLMLINSAIYMYGSKKNWSLSMVIIFFLPLFFSNFFLLPSVNGIRQGIATFWVLFAFGAALRGKYLIAGVLFLISIFSHNTSIVFAPIFALWFLKDHKTRWIFFVIGSMIYISIGDFVIQNSGRAWGSDQQNNLSIQFTLVWIILFLTQFYFELINNSKKITGVLKSKAIIGSLYSMIAILPFYYLPNTYERMAYYTIPITYILMISTISMRKFSNRTFVTILLVIPIILYALISYKAITMNFSF